MDVELDKFLFDSNRIPGFSVSWMAEAAWTQDRSFNGG